MTYLMRTNWWKWVTVVILLYVAIAGFLFPVPRLPILNETIRVVHFHVPMWFGMIFLLLASFIYAILFLSSEKPGNDIISSQLAMVGLVYGLMGMVSGMVWATFTWGEPWSSDPKQNAAAIGLLIYFAYFILRGSMQDEHQRAKISAVYNIFAFAALIPLLFILPRMTDSLHPGNGGNPGFNTYDMDSNLRMVFYPAVIGWTMVGFWIAMQRIRYRTLVEQNLD